jgi:hypothetical protein
LLTGVEVPRIDPEVAPVAPSACGHYAPAGAFRGCTCCARLKTGRSQRCSDDPTG